MSAIYKGRGVWNTLNEGNIDKLLFNKCKLFTSFVFFELSPQHDILLYRIKFSQVQLLRKVLTVLLCEDLLQIPLNTKQTGELYYITPTEEIKAIIKAWYKTGLKEPEDKNLPYYTYKKEVENE